MSDSKTNVYGGVIASAFPCFFVFYSLLIFICFFLGVFGLYFFSCSLLWLFFLVKQEFGKCKRYLKLWYAQMGMKEHPHVKILLGYILI